MEGNRVVRLSRAGVGEKAMTEPLEPRVLEVLDRSECMALLRGAQIGRLAFVLHGRPHIEVVNFVVHGDAILVRCGVGAKTVAVGRGDRLALEADDIDEQTHTGWNVTVSGRARLVPVQDTAALLPLVTPWAAGERTRMLRLLPDAVSGRRLAVADRTAT
jgi:nitroimidazol reductase NimA-like FMN-containing flavoprotein (pyridoxamine 5'-phosphate oxidase superfamily)